MSNEPSTTVGPSRDVRWTMPDGTTHTATPKTNPRVSCLADRFGRYPLPKTAYDALIAASVCVDADAETESSEGRVGAGTRAARAINRALALHRKARS